MSEHDELVVQVLGGCPFRWKNTHTAKSGPVKYWCGHEESQPATGCEGQGITQFPGDCPLRTKPILVSLHPGAMFVKVEEEKGKEVADDPSKAEREMQVRIEELEVDVKNLTREKEKAETCAEEAEDKEETAKERLRDITVPTQRLMTELEKVINSNTGQQVFDILPKDAKDAYDTLRSELLE